MIPHRWQVWIVTGAAVCFLAPSAGGAVGMLDPSRLEGMAAFPLPALLALIVLATFISEDLTCISAGLLVANGAVAFAPAVIACFLGIYIGDGLLYLAGRYLGPVALQRPPLRWCVHPDDIRRSAEWFRHNGPAVIISSRFIPGTRLPTYVAAGVLKMSYLRFSLFFFVAALIWTPILVGGAALAGQAAIAYFEVYRAYAIWVFLGSVVVLWFAVSVVVPLFSFRGRRLLLCRWRRFTRWEFWSPWVFYPPLIPALVHLAIRHRSLTAWTAANPAMPAGGFIGESKHAILHALSGTGDAVARFALVPSKGTPTARAAFVTAFMETHGLEYPIVLKPDAGQRGSGVAIVHGMDEATAYFERHPADTLVQAYAPGREFGIFYYRYPEEDRGRILSITDKRLIHVVGDGKQTLESLILSDERAVCMARYHLRRHSDQLYDVPAQGESIPLVELGTHCRGATFLDGAPIETPTLLACIDRISQSFEGFYFGRYDIRTPSVEALQRGESFQIIELNGVTSEATHIYHPGSPLRGAYRALREQWRIAFEIGAANIRRGVRPTGPVELARMLYHYCRSTRLRLDPLPPGEAM